jgi:hypothetical protein
MALPDLRPGQEVFHLREVTGTNEDTRKYVSCDTPIERFPADCRCGLYRFVLKS